MDKIRKLLLVFALVLVLATIGCIFIFRNNKGNAIVPGKVCGGWNTYGETVCSCLGKYTKEKCPPNTQCDSGGYYCEGSCGSCKCYFGSERDGKEVPCPKNP